MAFPRTYSADAGQAYTFKVVVRVELKAEVVEAEGRAPVAGEGVKSTKLDVAVLLQVRVLCSDQKSNWEGHATQTTVTVFQCHNVDFRVSSLFASWC